MAIPKGYQRIEGSNRQPAAGARRVGDVDPNETMTATVLVRRRANAKELPDPMALAPMPLGQQKYLSREEFANRFGATLKDLKLVEDFGREHGLNVVESSAAKRIVVLSGTAQKMSDAFFIKLGCYKSPTETYRGREGYVLMPEAVAKVVEGVFGLDNRHMVMREKKRSEAVKFSSETVKFFTWARPLNPSDIARSLYNFPATTDGSGQAIGILAFDGYDKTDIGKFFSDIGLSTPQLTDVGVLGTQNKVADPLGQLEVTTDIDVAGSIAPGAHIVVYLAPYTEEGWVNAIQTAITDNANKPSVLSISFGFAEGKEAEGLTWTDQAIRAVNSAFKDAARLGITVFAASGDWGSSYHLHDGKAHVSYPASDPYVIACGGTMILNTTCNGIWPTPLTEVTWPGTGGGISDVFPMPSWQQGIGVPPSVNDGQIRRGVPDIAGLIGCYINIFVNGKKESCHGTSVTAPIYAGLIALINASLPNPVGYLNPRLYYYGKTPSLKVFNEINDAVCNTSYGVPGYYSRPGWDACTGWGSINGNALLDALKLYGIITGNVVDAKGMPISYASIVIKDSKGKVAAGPCTDLSGNYISGPLTQSDYYSIDVHKSGFASGHKPKVDRWLVGSPQDFNLELAKPFTLKGKVTDSKGNPINDAIVSDKISNAKTDNQGAYSITEDNPDAYIGPYSGNYHITVVAEGFVTGEFDIPDIPNGATITHDFALLKHGILNGKVIQKPIMSREGKPINGATVLVGKFTLVEGGTHGYSYWTTTDASGLYSLTISVPGIYYIVVAKKGYETSDEAKVTIIPDTIINQNFILAKSTPGNVAGTVTTVDGMPLKNANVAALVYPSDYVSAQTDHTGNYMLSDVPSGPKYVSAQSRFYKVESQYVRVIASSTITVDFKLEKLSSKPKKPTPGRET